MKFKIITGYLLTTLLVFLAAWYLYARVISVITAPNEESDPIYEKSALTSIAISSLYEVDYYGNRLMQSYNNANLKDYRKALKKLNVDIDSLGKVMTDKGQTDALKEIGVLIKNKEKNISELTSLYQKNSVDVFYQETIEKVINETQEDTIVAKKGFFRRIGNAFKKQEIDTTSHKKELITALELVQSDVSKRQEKSNSLIASKLQALVRTEQRISGQISLLINELNREATESSMQELNAKRVTLHDAGRIVAIVAILAVVMIVVFLTLIMMDINKSQRYKRALEAARRKAEELMLSRQALLFNISHDIKAPLSSITGYLDLIEQNDYAHSMKLSAGHIQDLLTNLLDYARMEQGKAVISNGVFNIDTLIETIHKIFIPLAAEKGLEFEVKSGGRGGFIETDEIRVRRIVMNLLSNAVKFTDKGKIVLFYEITDNQLYISVQDSGCGIEESKQQTIFDEFTRVDEGREGNGLGLAVVHGAVELLGGVISLESSVNEGSLFNVVLPVQCSDEQVEIVFAKALNLLIIDDDKLQLKMCEEMLRKLGHTVFVATNIEEVLEILSKTRIDVLLSDLQMGKESGLQLIREIREKGYLTPVVAVSGSEPDHYKENGFCDFLKKPFTLNELKQMIGIKIDIGSLREMMGDDKEAIHEIVQLFLDSTVENKELLCEFLKNRNYVAIKRLCHKMLPMFMQFKINDVAERLSEIDRNDAEKIDPLNVALIIYRLNCFSLL